MQLRRHTTRATRRADRSQHATVGHGALTRGRVVLAMLLFFVVNSTSLGQAVVNSRREYNVKAVNLYAFGRYVTWPDHTFPSSAGPFIIGVFGKSHISGALDQIAAKKTVQGRAIQIRTFEKLEQLNYVHILFVSKTVDRATEAKLFQAVKGNNLLLVGETPGFAHRGGAFNFFLHGQNVRFEMNARQAEQEGFKLNAMLYNLGVRISADERNDQAPVGAQQNAVAPGR